MQCFVLINKASMNTLVYIFWQAFTPISARGSAVAGSQLGYV